MPQAVRACRELLLRSWEPEEAPPLPPVDAAPRSRGLKTSLRLLECSDESEGAATLGIGVLSAAKAQRREFKLDNVREADGNGMARLTEIDLADASPRIDDASRLQLSAATSQAHQALPPAVREAQARRAGAGPPPPSRAHALAAHTTRTRARYYTTGPQAMAD